MPGPISILGDAVMAKTGCNSTLVDLTTFFGGKRDVENTKTKPQLTRMIYNVLDEINGLLGRGRHFNEGA